MENESADIWAVHTRRESYEPFFDCGWVIDLEEVTKDLPDLRKAFYNVAFAWRGASNTHYLPSQTVHLLEVLAGSLNPYGKDFKELVMQRLLQKTQHVNFSNMARRQLPMIVGQICDELYEDAKENPLLAFDKEDFWNDYVKNQEIQYTIIASQRMSYGAIYYAYEYFLLQVYLLVSGKPDSYRINKAKFEKDFSAEFGQELCNYCWFNDTVRIAGLVRNALVHRGGEETEDLKEEKHGLIVQSGRIQITPADTRALHNFLKDRVTTLVKESAAKLKGKP